MRGNLYRKMVLESKGIDPDTLDDMYLETAQGRINRGMKKKYRAIGYDKNTQSIIVEDPETGEKYPINIMHDMGIDVALNQVDAINAYLDAIKLNPNDNRIKAKSKLILAKVLQKALPAVELPQQISNKYDIYESDSNIVIPKELMRRLSREEFKAIVDHEIQHSHQERMFKRGSGEVVDNYGYRIQGSDVKRAMTIAAQKKLPGLFGPNKSIANNATTEWIKNYVNSPAGDKLEKSHDKYLFELEADAMAVRKNGAKVYTQALMHLYGMQAKTIKDMTLKAAENSAAQKLDKNIKALGNLRQYMHMHNGEIDDATLTKLVSFSESPVDKATSGLTQIITQIREIRSYARANNIPLNFGSIKEIMNTLNSFEKISLSFSNPYTTLNPARKEKLLKMDPSKRIAYIDKVYENCLNARKENVNIDKVVAKLDKQLEDIKKGFEARCQFCIAIEKAAPWAKEATTEFAIIFSDALNIVFSEFYTIEDFVVDLLYDESFMYVINSYEDPMVDYITECATFIDYDGIDFFEEAEELLSEKFDPEEDYDEEESEEMTEDETETEEDEDDGKMTVDDIDDSEFEEPVDDNFGGTNPYPVDSNRTVDVDITMANFGADNSPQQNQYDPKEIERLNALISSENSAIGEYFQASKETNVDVLRRLYSDIGEEERFHSEQLLFAKSQITGERYVPRDPDVKREYEELLSMGMDEETAMTTAVDKVGLMSKGQEISPEESIQQMEFVVDQLEMVQKSIYQEYLLFELTTSSMMNSTRKRDEAFAVYTEAYINDVFSSPEVFLEEVANSTEKDKSDVKILSISIKGFLKLIGNIIGAIKRVAHSIAIWATNMRQHRKAKIKWLKNHSILDLFRHGLHLYFYDDEKAQFTYDDATKYLNRLRLATSMIANKVGVQFQEKNPQTASVADNFNPSTIDDAVNNIRNVSLSKTKVILNDKNTTMFLDQAFGVGQDLNNASNNSVYNKFDVLLKDFNSACESTKSLLEKMEQMEGDKNSLRYKDVDLYKKMVDSLKYVLKSYQMFINALTSDLQTLANADKEFTRAATQESGENTENETTGNPEQQTPTTPNNTPTTSTASTASATPTKSTTSTTSTASTSTNPEKAPTASGTPAAPAASGEPGNSGEPAAPSEQKKPGFFERRKETRRQENEIREQQSANKKNAEIIKARRDMSDIDEKVAEYNLNINKDIINTVRDKLTLLMQYYNDLNQIVVYEYDQDILADNDEIYVELSMPFGFGKRTNAYVDNLKRDYMNDIMSSARKTFKAYFDTIKKFVDSGQNIDVKPVIENCKWMLKNCKPIMTDDVVTYIKSNIKYLSNKK